MFKRKGNIIYFKSTKKSIKKSLFTNYVIWKKKSPSKHIVEMYYITNSNAFLVKLLIIILWKLYMCESIKGKNI